VIAGGVVGGVILLALIVLGIWFFRFRRRNDRTVTPAQICEAAGPNFRDAHVREQDLNEMPGQLAGNPGYSEMAVPEVLPAKEGNLKPARISPAELA
jgi:hypothetical protein